LLTAPQADRKGRPYYTRRWRRLPTWPRILYRPTARVGPTICRAHLYRGTGERGGSRPRARDGPRSVNFRPPQASRQGWPYSIRAARAPWGGVVYSRATPGGWPAWPSHGLQL